MLHVPSSVCASTLQETLSDYHIWIVLHAFNHSIYTHSCHLRWGTCIKIKIFADRLRGLLVWKLMEQCLLKLEFSGDGQQSWLYSHTKGNVCICIECSSELPYIYLHFSFLAAGCALPRDRTFWMLLFRFLSHKPQLTYKFTPKFRNYVCFSV